MSKPNLPGWICVALGLGIAGTAGCECSVSAGDSCGPRNCPGCCDVEGRCQSGDAAGACGGAGAQCRVCSPGASCGLGQCGMASTGDAGTDAGGGDGGDAGASSGSDAGSADGGSTDGGAWDSGWGCSPVAPGTQAFRSGPVDPHIPHLLWNGQVYAATWDEYSTPSITSDRVQFSFVSPTGMPIPGSQVSLSAPDGGDSFWPRLAYSGSEYGIVYDTDVLSSQRRAYFARIDGAGHPVAGSEVALPVVSGNGQEDVVVAWNPSSAEWGVAWWEDGTPFKAWFARIAASGGVIAGSTLAIGSSSSAPLVSQGSSPLLSAGGKFVVVWEEQGTELLLQEIDGAGVPIPASRTVIAPGATTNPFGPSIATNGSVYAVVWRDALAGTSGQVRFALVQVGGGYVPGSDVALGSPGAWFSNSPNVTWNGGEFVVSWNESNVTGFDNQLWVGHVALDGGVLSRSQVATSPGTTAWNDIVWNGCTVAVPFQWEPADGGHTEDRVVFLP